MRGGGGRGVGVGRGEGGGLSRYLPRCACGEGAEKNSPTRRGQFTPV